MIALDFETYYSRAHTVSDQGPWAYAHHPDTDIYMVAVRGEGLDYVGECGGFDWSQLNGKDLDGWLRLANARKMLGELPAARKALDDAAEIYKDDEPALARIAAAREGLNP